METTIADTATAVGVRGNKNVLFLVALLIPDIRPIQIYYKWNELNFWTILASVALKYGYFLGYYEQ